MNEYVMMFDSLQEGIIVVDRAQEISFMNEISNKIFSKITGMVDFFKNQQSDEDFDSDLKVPQDKEYKNPIDLKIFHIFENNSNND